MAIGDLATWGATLIAFCSGVIGLIFGVLGYRQAKRVAARDEEDWFVDWTIRWNHEETQIILQNVGGQPARDTTVTVSGDQIHVSGIHFGSVAPGAWIRAQIPDIAALRSQHDIAQRDKVDRFRDTGIAAFATEFHAPLMVTVQWRTGLHFPRSRSLAIEVS